MKYLLLFSISFFTLKCFAQNDSLIIKHRQLLLINPTQIVTGHPPDCYYDPDYEYHNHYTYSAEKDNYGAKFFVLTTLASNRHLICQWYLGGGLLLGYGEKTAYYKTQMYSAAHECVDIHDPGVLTSQSPLHYVVPTLNYGIRLVFL